MNNLSITNKTQLNVVIGHPLTHSRSPILHNFIYQALGLNAVMLACDNLDASALMHACRTFKTQLIAVTMPFKERILPLLDHASTDVTQLGAANTVICREEKLHGYNTDIAGIHYALRNTILADKRILIVGAGGAARAVASAVNTYAGVQLFWFNRTTSRAQNCAKEFGGTVVQESQLFSLSSDIDVIINTTPLGMYPGTIASPLADFPFQSKHTVFDLIYNPIATALLHEAKQQGAAVISGLEMFIGQGILQIELWTGQNISGEKKLIADLRETLIQSLELN